MKILFVTYDLPYPQNSGGKIRAFNLIKALAAKHEVTLFSYFRTDGQKRHLPALRKICSQVVTVKRRSLFSPFNLLFMPFRPFPAALYKSGYAEKKLQDLIAQEKYDLVHLESFYTSNFLPQKKSKTVFVLGTENIEWHVYRHYAERQSKTWLKKLLSLEVRRLRQFEEESWRKADFCLAVSENDAQEIRRRSRQPVVVIPNGVDPDYFQFQTRPEQSLKKILFLGNFSYIQNKDAAKFILEAVWPEIKKQARGLKIELLFAGAGSETLLSAGSGSQVKTVGTIKDLRRFYHEADLLLAPLRVGSGTKFKILEAMACGLPVVTTSLGSSGLAVKNNVEILIADQPVDLAKAVLKLLRGPVLRAKMVAKARALVVNKYHWSKIGRKLNQAYETFDRHR